MSEIATNAGPIDVPAPQPPAAGEIEALAALLPDPAAPTGVDVGTAVTSVKATPEEKVAEAKTEETPTEAKPATPDEAAEAAAALERAEAAAKRAREGSRRYREMLAEQERVKQEAARAASEAARARREAEEARQFQAKLKEDPYRALKDLGMTDQQLAERALREGTPEQAIHELKAQIEAQRQALEAERQAREAERQAAQARQAEIKFQQIADNETAYPRLAQLSPKAQLTVARAALEQIAENGYDTSGLSDEQVAEACERYLAPKKGKSASAKPPAPAAAKPPVKTLTNSVATEKASASKPWDELTEEEQIAQIAAMLPDPG